MQALGAWLCGAVLCALTILHALDQASPESGAFVLGLLLAAAVLVSTLIGGKFRPASVVFAIGWCAGIGVWFPFWEARSGIILSHWWPSMGLSAERMDDFVLPAAILSAGMVTGVVLYLPTRSARIVGQATLLSLLLAGTPLVPAHADVAVGVAGSLWILGLSGALYGRAIHRVLVSVGEVCEVCNYDLDGLDGPSCPRCGSVIEARRTTIVPGTLVPSRVNDAA